MSELAFLSGIASTWRTVFSREISRRFSHDACAREDRVGRFTCHSRSTTSGLKPATDSSEVAATIPSFVSTVQVAGTSKAKQVPVKVRFMASRFLRPGSSGPIRCHGSGPVGVSWVLFLGKSRGGLQKQFPERFIRVAGQGDLFRIPVILQDRHAAVRGHHPRELRALVRAEQG